MGHGKSNRGVECEVSERGVCIKRDGYTNEML